MYYNPRVTNLTTSDVKYNEFIATATAQGGTNTLKEYYFSKDNGATWEKEESTATSVTHTFTGLTASTGYKVKAYVVDIQSKQSEVYPSGEGVVVTTSAYVNPSVTALTVDSSSITKNGFTVTATASKGSSEIDGYYFSVSTDKNTWTNESTKQTTNSYTFTTLSTGTAYYVRVRVVDIQNKETIFTTTSTTVPSSPTLAMICSSGTSLATCITNSYGKIDNLYYHTSSLANSAEDSSYRFAGPDAEVNNYVCFGSDTAPCPEGNKYRIIGVIGNKVKLIKATRYSVPASTYSGTYAWSGAESSESNSWSSSTLNTTILNGTASKNYLGSFNSTWQSKIATTTWYVGGMSTYNGRHTNAKTVYDYEIGANRSSTTVSKKIGLMYLSDYYYAASPTYWTTKGSDYGKAKTSNWMIVENYVWTISRDSDTTNLAFNVSTSGYVDSNPVGNMNAYSVRPVFFLTSSVTYQSGTGEASNPIIIS